MFVITALGSLRQADPWGLQAFQPSLLLEALLQKYRCSAQRSDTMSGPLTSTCVHIHAFVPNYSHVHEHAHTHACTHTCTKHAHSHVYTHTHTHAHT